MPKNITQLPEIGARVNTKRWNDDIYTGTVSSHGITDSPVKGRCFFMQVEQVNGVDKDPAHYPHPIVCHVDEIVG